MDNGREHACQTCTENYMTKRRVFCQIHILFDGDSSTKIWPKRFSFLIYYFAHWPVCTGRAVHTYWVRVKFDFDQKIGSFGEASSSTPTLMFVVRHLTMRAGAVTPSAPTRFGFRNAFAMDENAFQCCYLRCVLPGIGKWGFACLEMNRNTVKLGGFPNFVSFNVLNRTNRQFR